jgi:hypothetical protein
MKIDIVYPLGTGSKWQDSELRFSLRSIEKNFIDKGTVWVIGHKPDWLINARHIPMPDKHKHNKDANIIEKILGACYEKDLTENFLRLSDDQLILQPIFFSQVKPYHIGPIKPKHYKDKGPWFLRFKNTYDYLVENNLSTYYYDTHVPMPVNKNKFIQVMSKVDLKMGYTINTLYFNSIESSRTHLMFDGIKANLGIKFHSVDKIRNHMKGKLYGGYNEKALTVAFKRALQAEFPNKSKYEKNDMPKIKKINYNEIVLRRSACFLEIQKYLTQKLNLPNVDIEPWTKSAIKKLDELLD